MYSNSLYSVVAKLQVHIYTVRNSGTNVVITAFGHQWWDEWEIP